MSQPTAAELRERFARVAAETRALVENARPAWSAPCAEEGWTVGATLAHVAAGYERQRRWLSALLEDDRIADFDWEQTHALNAENVARLTTMTPDEVVAALDGGANALAGHLATLGDRDLDRPAIRYEGTVLTLSSFVRGFLIGHPPSHVGSVRRAIVTGGG